MHLDFLGKNARDEVEAAAQSFALSEHFPFGSRRTAYEVRWLKYLRELSELGRAAAP
jgi:hypothetical protein